MKKIWLCGVLSLATGCAAESTQTNEAADTAARVCSGDEQVAAFQAMIKSPLVPGRAIGGVDLTQEGSWRGVKLEDMEQTLCQSSPRQIDDPGLTGAAWGLSANPIFEVDFDTATRRVKNWALNAGYQGTIDFRSRPHSLDYPGDGNPFGTHTYSIGLGRSILRDGQPWTLAWNQSCTPDSVGDCWQRQLTELYDGMLFTFAPELPSTQGNCVAEQKCLGSKAVGNIGIFGARPLGTYIVIGDLENAPSTPQYFYGFFSKNMPASTSDVLLKLDAEGPVATATRLGDRGASCTIKLGQPFASFVQDCVRVMNDGAQNDGLQKKALGGSTRVMSTFGGKTRGTWLLDIAGVRPSFASERFDEREPTAQARATELVLDLRATGKVKNDYRGEILTLAGSSAVYAEYARQVQAFLHARMPAAYPRFPIGAPECLQEKPAFGCTGIEQIVLPGDPAAASDPGLRRVSVGPVQAGRLGLRTVLKPGFIRVAFCSDPGTFEHCAEDDGSGTGFGGRLVETMKHVEKVFGEVDDETKDVKLYVRLFAKALVKYLRAAGQSPTDLSAFDALTPADTEIAIAEAGEVLTATYLDRLEIKMNKVTGEMTSMVLR
jgi:hypothetical protein